MATFKIADFKHKFVAAKDTLIGGKKIMMTYGEYTKYFMSREAPFKLSAQGAAKRCAFDTHHL